MDLDAGANGGCRSEGAFGQNGECDCDVEAGAHGILDQLLVEKIEVGLVIGSAARLNIEAFIGAVFSSYVFLTLSPLDFSSIEGASGASIVLGLLGLGLPHCSAKC